MRIARVLLACFAAMLIAGSATARPLMDVTPREAAVIEANAILATSASAFSFAGYDGDPNWRVDAAHVSYALSDRPEGLALAETIELRMAQKFEDHVEPHVSLRRFDYVVAPGAELETAVLPGCEDIGELLPFEVRVLRLRCAVGACFAREGRRRQGRSSAPDQPLAWDVDDARNDAVGEVALMVALSADEAERLGAAIAMLARSTAFE